MRSRLLIRTLVLLPLTGCLEVEHTVTLNADGSGAQAVRMVVRDALLADLQRAAPAVEYGATDMRVLFDKEIVARELSAVGLKLERHAVTTTGGRRTVELTAAFPTFTALQRSPLAGSAAEWVLAAGPQPGTVKMTLFPQGQQAWREARARAEAMAGEIDGVAEEFFRKRREQLAGLDVVVRFRLPGDVLVWTANMDRTGDREVTARITAAQIASPQDLVRRLAPRFEVIFAASGCNLPGVSPAGQTGR